MPTPFAKRAGWIGACALALCCGCATLPYRYSNFHPDAASEAPPSEVAIEHGTPNKTLDRIAWVIGIPSRILPLHRKVNDHKLSDETAARLTEYLVANDLTDVQVYVNHYDPAGQWRRLPKNKRISPGWLYTFGVFSYLNYTFIPSRVFGGDAYNPYTNCALHQFRPAGGRAARGRLCQRHPQA